MPLPVRSVELLDSLYCGYGWLVKVDLGTRMSSHRLRQSTLHPSERHSHARHLIVGHWRSRLLSVVESMG